jgi:hypothetical protein
MAFEFAEIFALAVRQVAPAAAVRKLSLAFDHRGPLLTLPGDPAPLRAALHRLLAAGVELLDSGVLLFAAATSLSASGRYAINLRVAGTGLLTDNDAVTDVLARLHLVEEPVHSERDRPRLRRASGRCLPSQADVSFASLPSTGFVFSATPFSSEARESRGDQMIDARGASAWIIDADEITAESLASRLQRLGWTTAHHRSIGHAVRGLAGMPEDNARPRLVVVVESRELRPTSLADLRALLTGGTRVVYTMPCASPPRRLPAGVASTELQIFPLSPASLQDLTASLSPPIRPDSARQHARVS